MARFPEAEARILEGKWVCRSCGKNMRAPKGRKPEKCTSCGSKDDLRLKHKRRKK